MKKLVLTAFAAVLLAGCATKTDTVKKANFTQQDFVGEWLCLIRYPELSTDVYDAIQLNTDSSMLDEELISYMIDGNTPLLTYYRVSEGNWKLDKNQLIYSFTSQNVTKNHSPKLQAALNDKKKVAKSSALQKVKKLDDGLFKTLSNGSYKTTNIELDVLEVKPNYSFEIVQKLNDRTYRGACFSKQEMDKRK